jgi:hypothetical protein
MRPDRIAGRLTSACSSRPFVGGGRERLDPHAPGFKPNKMKGGIYFATDLQPRKMLNLPVGSSKDRSEVFKRM